jgi:hypothetical protein
MQIRESVSGGLAGSGNVLLRAGEVIAGMGRIGSGISSVGLGINALAFDFESIISLLMIGGTWPRIE